MNKERILKIVLPPLILTLSLIVFVWFVFIPAVKKGVATRASIATATANLQEVVKKDESLRKAKKSEARITKTAETVDGLWPDKEEVGGFIVAMEQLAAAKHLKINNIAVEESSSQAAKPKVAATPTPSASSSKTSDSEDATSKSKKTQKAEGTKFSFDTTGDYRTLIDLLTGLESLARFNSVSTMVLDGNPTGDTITFRVTGYIYAN